MSNRISDADIDAILREFSEQQEQETRAAESAPSRRRESAAPAAQERSPRRESRPEPRTERSKERAPQPAPRREARQAPERPKERDARSRPQPPREATPVRPAFSFGYLILIVLSILALVWALVNVHPGTGTNTGSTTENRLDLVGKLDVFMNNSASDALENVAYIKKIYTIPESDLVAPKPDQSKFGSTTDPAVVQAVVDSAAELLEGQELIWNPDIVLMEGSEIEYYCDETILVIAWKEAINNSACSFVEVKIAHGSQLRRALSDNTYGSSVYMYPTQMAQNANAVVAINGDFYGHRSCGITIYQRQLYRFNPRSLESCFFTASGDMIFTHVGELNTEDEVKKFVQDNDIVFSVSFGPILVENGEKKTTNTYLVGEVDIHYSRAAIGQVDKLHYLLMSINEEGVYKNRVTINQAADLIYAKGVPNAYALDGGQTATIVMNGETFNRPDWGNERIMTDIIYFATAIPGEEASS
ncbi:MAG: phosphodiester glycosidase family protein [Clostridiales bacterium]|nr:phosphodiester glycosidase family protein [Clostridiales bacterium]